MSISKLVELLVISLMYVNVLGFRFLKLIKNNYFLLIKYLVHKVQFFTFYLLIIFFIISLHTYLLFKYFYYGGKSGLILFSNQPHPHRFIYQAFSN